MGRYFFAVFVTTVSFCAQANADLIGHWLLDGDATAAVGTHGVIVNGATATTGRFGDPNGALAFDGSLQQFVEIAGVIFSRQRDFVDSQSILSLTGTDPDSSGVRWWARNSFGEHTSTGIDVGDGIWNHIAVTFGPGGSELFINGVSHGTRLGNASMTATGANLTLGALNDRINPFSVNDNYLTGALDDVRVYDNVLTDNEIRLLAGIPEPGGGCLVAAVAFIGLLYRRKKS